MGKEYKLPSGAVLEVQPAPFADAKALYQAVLEEIKVVQINSSGELGNLFKDLACIGFSSKKIEAALEQCFKRCLYNGSKIDKSTFEPVEAREDYMPLCVEVAKENIMPFTKSLYAQYKQLLALIPSVQV